MVDRAPMHFTQTNFEKVQEFQTKMEMARDVWPYGKGLRDLRYRLIEEEFNELADELMDPIPDKRRIAKEAADLLYVTYGLLDALGIRADHVFKLVHASNMSKLGNDGRPVKREDGKITKGPNYKPVNLDDLL
jgi:predicted HAD superfamily Cof-like phosphohydrolase